MYTWNKDWVWKYESMWSVFNKFLLSNHATSLDLDIKGGRINHGIKNPRSRFLCYVFDSYINQDKLHSYLGTDMYQLSVRWAEELLESCNLSNIRDADQFTLNHQIVRSHIRYCPECMKNGFHAVFHQYAFLSICPIHKVHLIDRCLKCDTLHQYGILINSNKAYTLPCGYVLYEKGLYEAINDWTKPFDIKNYQWFNSKAFRDNKILLYSDAYKENDLNEDMVELLKSKLSYQNNIKPSYRFNPKSITIDKDFYSQFRDLTDVSLLYQEALRIILKHLRKKYRIKFKILIISLITIIYYLGLPTIMTI